MRQLLAELRAEHLVDERGLPGRPAGRPGSFEGTRPPRGHRGSRCDGHLGGGVQPDPSRRRWARRRPSLAWQLDDRAAPDTVPMKAVPQQCGALGRLRPALPAQSGGVVGPSSSIVPVRWMPHPGRLVQPLRSWQPVLRPRLLSATGVIRPLQSRRNPATRGLAAVKL